VQAKRLAHHDGAPCVLCGHALVRTGNFVVHQEEVVRKGKCSHCAYLQPIYRKWDTP
jgi:prolipoprotein diacylglyceryltransferase